MLISYGLNIYSGSRFYSFKWCTFQLVWWCIFQLVYTFPIRGKKLFLNIRRRRWIVKDDGRYVSRNWKLVAEGSRMTHEFASFLKELY